MSIYTLYLKIITCISQSNLIAVDADLDILKDLVRGNWSDFLDGNFVYLSA